MWGMGKIAELRARPTLGEKLFLWLMAGKPGRVALLF